MGWNRAMRMVAFAKYTERSRAQELGIYEREWPESASKLSINRYRHSNFLAKDDDTLEIKHLCLLQAYRGFPHRGDFK